MKVYKFGGASVRNADGVRNLRKIIDDEQNLFIIVSAMGKTTNALEKVFEGVQKGDKDLSLEQVAALRLYAEHPAYDGQLLVVCFQNIAAAERVVDHLRRIEMLPQVDVEDLIMSRCAKNGTAEKPQSRFFAVALRYSVSKSCDSLCPFSSTRNDTRWRCSLEMSLCLKTI